MKTFFGFVLAFLLAVGCLKADNIAVAATSRGTFQFTVLTYTATNICLTYTASCPYCKLMAAPSVYSGGNIQFSNIYSATTPSSLTTSPMAFGATLGNSALFYGPYVPAHWLHIVALLASAVVNVELDNVP